MEFLSVPVRCRSEAHALRLVSWYAAVRWPGRAVDAVPAGGWLFDIIVYPSL